MAQAACSICRSRALSFSRAGPWSVRTCECCGHRSILGATEVGYDEGYAGFGTDTRFQAVLEQEIRDRFLPRLPSKGAILDVGCGNGDFLALAQDAGFKAIGLDVSSAAVRMCRERGLSAEAGNFLTLSLPQADAVTMWDVIEHVRDPAAFFARASELLRPGGFLVVKTPAVSSLSFRVVRFVPRASGALLHSPSHIEFFSEPSIRLAAREVGLELFELDQIGGIRERRRGGSLKRRVARGMRRLVDRLGANGNFYAWFRKPEAAC